MTKEAIIIGAGVAGKSLAKALEKENYKIVGFLDDNLDRDHTLKILGKLKDINTILNENSVDEIFFAIPTAPSKTIRDFILSLDKEVKISLIPRSFEIISKNTVSVDDLTDIDILEMLGRHPIKHDLKKAKGQLKGKTVLITGAAGSIGSTLVKQLILMEPKQIVGIDWWENGIFDLGRRLGKQKNLTLHIGNIQDTARLEELFRTYQPDFVFHAAAYKHVPLMQNNAREAFTNNVIGSMNVMKASIDSKVKSFVYVSTDKAVNPTNVMGATKRLGEKLLKHFAKESGDTKLSAVRFGNVIESNGSVIPIFKEQIRKDLPLTVTHKDITRFFMTKDEAAQLIIQSSILAKSGEIFVLDMGEQIRIDEVARSMVKLSGKNLTIEYTGLRPGEKMYEELYYNAEDVDTTTHPKIYTTKDNNGLNTEAILTAVEQISSKQLDNKQVINVINNLGFNINR